VSGDLLDEGLEALDALFKITHSHDFRYQIEKLESFKRLVLSGLPFQVGGKVAISDSFRGPTQKSPGWWPSREFLKPGHTGTVKKIDIRPSDTTLFAEIIWDDEWTISERGDSVHRYDDLAAYDGVTPEDRRHVYMFSVKHLRAATADDHPFLMPGRAPGLREAALSARPVGPEEKE